MTHSERKYRVHRKGRRAESSPIVTVSGRWGSATLNEVAWRHLRSPEAVLLLSESSLVKNVLVLKGAPRDDPNAYAIRQTATRSKTRAFSMRGFLTYHGFRFRDTRRYYPLALIHEGEPILEMDMGPREGEGWEQQGIPL